MKENYCVIEQENISPKMSGEAATEYFLSRKLTGISEATIDKYRVILERFLTDCCKDIGKPTLADVQAWRNAYCGDQNEGTNVHSRLTNSLQLKGSETT